MSYQQPPPPPPAPGSGAMRQNEERNWAMAAHIGTLVAAWVAMGFLAPLIVMLAVGERSPYARRHAVESLNFQISLLVYLFVGFLVALLTLGIGLIVIIPAAAIVGIFALIAIIMGTMAASRGEDFRYPLCIRLIS